jgi:hypothetical protein
MCADIVPSIRISADNKTILVQLGLLKSLAGNSHGKGSNLFARPTKRGFP